MQAPRAGAGFGAAVLALVLWVGLSTADVAVAAIEDCGATGDLLGATFFGIGAPSEEDPYAISSDGSTVVGGPDFNFRWTRSGGFAYITLGINDSAYDASDDGSVVVGVKANFAYRWTSATGAVFIPLGVGRAVSADGSVVVGNSGRWTSATGPVGLGDLPGGAFYTEAFGVSADGSIVVGVSSSAAFSEEAFRWTSAGGIVGLGTLPGTVRSEATGISGDGLTIVGNTNTGFPAHINEAFRWTSAGGMVGLGIPAGFTDSRANAVSDDGSIVVGTLFDPIVETHAAVWDATNGWRELTDILTSLGVNIGTWVLEGAQDITADGCTITGRGLEPNGDREPWVIDFFPINITPDPEPTPALGPLAFATLVLSLLGALILRSRLR